MSQGFTSQLPVPLPVAQGGTGLTTTANSAIFTTNSSGVPSWTAYSAISPTIQKFTSGSGTYTTPAGVKYIAIQMVGGGGGGAGSSSASNGGTGGTGGSTLFGSSLLTCNAGAGGTGANPTTGGAGGTTTIAAGPLGFSYTGQKGGAGSSQGPASVNAVSGAGGNSFFSGAGPSVASADTPAIIGNTAVTNSGSGGGGSAYLLSTTSGFTGGGGGAGGYIQAVINSPSATYSYTVGTAGTAGAAGTLGATGGAGAAGIIIVYEYYN